MGGRGRLSVTPHTKPSGCCSRPPLFTLSWCTPLIPSVRSPEHTEACVRACVCVDVRVWRGGAIRGNQVPVICWGWVQGAPPWAPGHWELPLTQLRVLVLLLRGRRAPRAAAEPRVQTAGRRRRRRTRSRPPPPHPVPLLSSPLAPSCTSRTPACPGGGTGGDKRAGRDATDRPTGTPHTGPWVSTDTPSQPQPVSQCTATAGAQTGAQAHKGTRRIPQIHTSAHG